MRQMQEESWVEGVRLVTLNGGEYLLSVKCYEENVTSVLPPFFFHLHIFTQGYMFSACTSCS